MVHGVLRFPCDSLPSRWHEVRRACMTAFREKGHAQTCRSAPPCHAFVATVVGSGGSVSGCGCWMRGHRGRSRRVGRIVSRRGGRCRIEARRWEWLRQHHDMPTVRRRARVRFLSNPELRGHLRLPSRQAAASPSLHELGRGVPDRAGTDHLPLLQVTAAIPVDRGRVMRQVCSECLGGPSDASFCWPDS